MWLFFRTSSDIPIAWKTLGVPWSSKQPGLVPLEVSRMDGQLLRRGFATPYRHPTQHGDSQCILAPDTQHHSKYYDTFRKEVRGEETHRFRHFFGFEELRCLKGFGHLEISVKFSSVSTSTNQIFTSFSRHPQPFPPNHPPTSMGPFPPKIEDEFPSWILWIKTRVASLRRDHHAHS